MFLKEVEWMHSKTIVCTNTYKSILTHPFWANWLKINAQLTNVAGPKHRNPFALWYVSPNQRLNGESRGKETKIKLAKLVRSVKNLNNMMSFPTRQRLTVYASSFFFWLSRPPHGPDSSVVRSVPSLELSLMLQKPKINLEPTLVFYSWRERAVPVYR